MWAAIVGNSQVTDLLIQATCDIFAKDATWLKAGRCWEGFFDTSMNITRLTQVDYQHDLSTAKFYNLPGNFLT